MRKALAEYLGTLILTMTVVGSGIMATNLSSDQGIQLLINAAATGAVLWLLINAFADVSGAHFNPVVTVISRFRGELRSNQLIQFILGQIAGAISGAALANLLFDLDPISISQHSRDGWNLLLSEAIATFGLLFIIFHLTFQKNEKKIPGAVAGWIFAAYFFTSSTSFANPAVTIGRTLTDTFSGIAPHSALAFIPIQLISGIAGYAVAAFLNQKPFKVATAKPQSSAKPHNGRASK